MGVGDFEVDGGGAPEFDVEPYDEFEDIDTGPYCRHFRDPADCDEKCLRCNHECHEHEQNGLDDKCNHDGCECPDWKEDDG